MYCLFVFTLYVVHFVQVAIYKTDFERERADREHMAGVVETEKSKNTYKQRLSPGVHEDESKRQAQIKIMHEDYQRAIRKISELDTEIVDLKEMIKAFNSKEECLKRSLEEASATNTKLSEDNQVLIQQVRQYKKQSDNLRSQVDELKQANSSLVQQVCAAPSK